MKVSTKKLIGTILILLWIMVYIIICWGIGIRVLPDANWLVRFLFYALAGTLWIVPVGMTLPWMYREPNRK